MANCASCMMKYDENDCFCLNCGILLRDYNNIKLSEEELSSNINAYSSATEILNRELVKTTESCDEYINLFNNNEITKEAEINGICADFPNLTSVFLDYLKKCQDYAFNILAGFNYFHSSNSQQAIDELLDSIYNSLKNFHESLKSTKRSVENLDISQSSENSINYKHDLLTAFEKVITFHASFLKQLEIIKSKKVEIVCVECGFKNEKDFNFCPKCGVKLSNSDIRMQIEDLQNDYVKKHEKMKDLVVKFFNDDKESYNKFINALDKFSKIFEKQVFVAQNILEFNLDNNKSLEDAIKLLESINEKLDQLVDEMIIKNSSTEQEIEKVFDDFEGLINELRKS